MSIMFYRGLINWVYLKDGLVYIEKGMCVCLYWL